jgi:hypothetical protein
VKPFRKKPGAGLKSIVPLASCRLAAVPFEKAALCIEKIQGYLFIWS